MTPTPDTAPTRRDNPSAFERMRADYRATLKSMDTEEGIDLAFYRPIGYAWARLAKALGVTPNAITIASIFLGVGAGICFYYPSLWINVIGMLLLIWANSFDSADGQLARMTKQYSRIGRILDGLSGDFWFATIYVAICLREVHTSEFFMAHNWAIWALAVAAGVCHAKQAAMADCYRQFHLFFLKGEEGSELEDSPCSRPSSTPSHGAATSGRSSPSHSTPTTPASRRPQHPPCRNCAASSTPATAMLRPQRPSATNSAA